MESELVRATKGSFSFQFETFSQLKSALELIFSPSAASVILHVAAVKCGAHSYKRMMKRASTKEEILNHLSELKNDENWGKLSFLDVDFMNGSGRVIIADSFETITRKTTQPCCHFFRGFLAVFLSELFRKTIEITEEKCAGKGMNTASLSLDSRTFVYLNRLSLVVVVCGYTSFRCSLILMR